jgi:hypothetical protein
MKTYGGVDVRSDAFFTSSLVGDQWSASCPGRFSSKEGDRGTQCTGGWVGLEACLDDMEK